MHFSIQVVLTGTDLGCLCQIGFRQLTSCTVHKCLGWIMFCYNI